MVRLTIIFLSSVFAITVYSQEEPSPREVREKYLDYVSTANKLLSQKTVTPGDYEKAKERIHGASVLMEQYPQYLRNAKNLVSLGKGFKALGELDHCRQKLREAITLEPGNAYAHIRLAESYIDDIRTKGWYDSALVGLQRARNYLSTMKADEAQRECLLDISNGFKNIWAFEEARDLLQEFPKNHSQYVAALVAKGECFLGEPDTLKAEKNLNEASRSFNEARTRFEKMSVEEIINSEIDAGNLVTLGFWYTIVGEYSRGLQMADLALKVLPDYAAPYVVKAQAYMRMYEDSGLRDQNSYQKARANLETARTELGRAYKRCKDVGLLIAVADTYNRLGEPTAAANIVDSLWVGFEKDTGYVFHPLTRAQLYLNLMAYRRDETKAKEAFDNTFGFLKKSPTIRGKEDYYLALCAGFGILQEASKQDSVLEAARRLRPNYALLYLYWGEHQLGRGDLEGAIRFFEKARAFAESPPPSEASPLPGKEVDRYLPKIYSNLVEVNIRLGRLDTARYYLPKAMKKGPETGKMLLELGLAFKKQNQYEMARMYLEQALRFLESEKLTTGPLLLTLYVNLAEVCKEANQLDKTRAYLEQAKAILEATQNPDQVLLSGVYIDLAKLSEQWQEAVAYLEQAREIIQSSEKPDESLLSVVYADLGHLYKGHDKRKAEECFKQAKTLLESMAKPDRALLSDVYINLARLSEQWQEAITYLEQARELLQSLEKPDELLLSTIWVYLGDLYHEQGYGNKAQVCFEQAEHLLKSMEICDEALLAKVYFKLAEIYEQSGQIKKAAEYFEKTRQTLESILVVRTSSDPDLLHLLSTAYTRLIEYYRLQGQVEKAKKYSERVRELLNRMEKPDGGLLLAASLSSFEVLKPLADQQKKASLEKSAFEKGTREGNLLESIGYLEQLRAFLERARKVPTLSAGEEESLDQRLSIVYESLYDQNQLLGRHELGEYYLLKSLQGNPSQEIRLRARDFVSRDGFKISRSIGVSSQIEAGDDFIPTELYLIEAQFLGQTTNKEYQRNLRTSYTQNSLTRSILTLNRSSDLELGFRNAYLRSAFNKELYRFTNCKVNALDMALRSTVSFSKGDLQWRLGYRRLWFRGTDEISENRDNLFMDLRYRSFGNFLIEGTGFYTRGRHLHLNSRPKEWGTGLKLIQYHPRLGISETLLVQYENGTYPPSEAKTDRLVTIFQLTKKVGPRLFITPEIKYVNFKNQEQKRPLETISARTFDFASFLEYRFSALSLLAKAIYATGRDRRDFDSYIIEGGFVYALNLRLPSRIGKNTYHLGNRVTIQPGYRYARYFHLGEKLSAVYLQFNLFM